MATVGGFSRHHHLDELQEPLVTNEGVLSPAERQARARENLGLGTGTALVTPVAAPAVVGDTYSAAEVNAFRTALIAAGIWTA